MKKISILLILILLNLNCKTDPFIHFIEKYQQKETKMNEDRCSLYPTCSEYAKEIYLQKGLFGFFFIIERLLIRERGELSHKFTQVPESISPQKKRYFDPVENSFQKPSFLKVDF